MAVVSPSQSNPGDEITAAKINNPINQLAAVLNGNVDANNIADGSINNAKVAAGVQTVKFSNPYKFSAYLAGAQNVGTGATKVLFDTENFDTGNNFDITTNKGRFTAPVAGFYQFNTNVSTTTAGSGTNIAVYFYKNGSPIVLGANIPAAAGNNPGTSLSTLLSLNAADYVEVYIATGAAAKALDTGAGASANTFSGFLVSAT
jgi:hypothetical protein